MACVLRQNLYRTRNRLRDISQEMDHEQRRRIAEMEKDVTNLDDMQGTHFRFFCLQAAEKSRTAQYESTLIKLQNADAQIEDLKAQLADALGAEDLLVQLTERNLMLGEVEFTFHMKMICC